MDVIRSMRFPRVESGMYRARSSVMPEVPKTLDEFGALLQDPRYRDRFGTTKNGKPYCAATWSGPTAREGSGIVFISDNLRHMLSSAQYFHLDGHFKTTPAVGDCYQLVTIMPVAYDHVSLP